MDELPSERRERTLRTLLSKRSPQGTPSSERSRWAGTWPKARLTAWLPGARGDHPDLGPTAVRSSSAARRRLDLSSVARVGVMEQPRLRSCRCSEGIALVAQSCFSMATSTPPAPSSDLQSAVSRTVASPTRVLATRAGDQACRLGDQPEPGRHPSLLPIRSLTLSRAPLSCAEICPELGNSDPL